MKLYCRYILSLLAATSWSVVQAQTSVDLRTQSKSVDFSGAVSTKPFKEGTALPATCAVGEAFFKTDAPSGQNLYGCTALNAWTMLTSSSYIAGTGINITGLTVSVEDAVVPLYYTGSGAPTISCAAGRDYYADLGSGALYFCRATNVWQPVSNSGHTHGAADIISGTLDAARLPAVALTSTSVHTLTNKTIDAEGTGNTVTLPFFVSYNAAACQGATASTLFSTPSTGAPTAACVTGGNTNFGVLQFAANQAVQDHFTLPPDWTGSIDFYLKWRSSGVSGNAVWRLQTACVADGETSDPSWNTAQTVTDAAKGITLMLNDASLTAVTTTGCAAGEEMFFKLSLDSGSTTTGIDLVSTRFKLRRAM